DAKREREDGDGSDTSVRGEIADGIAHVASQVVEPDVDVSIAGVFVSLEFTAQLADGFAACLGGGEAFREVFFQPRDEVKLDFFLRLRIDLRAAEQVGEAMNPRHGALLRRNAGRG